MKTLRRHLENRNDRLGLQNNKSIIYHPTEIVLKMKVINPGGKHNWPGKRGYFCSGIRITKERACRSVGTVCQGCIGSIPHNT